MPRIVQRDASEYLARLESFQGNGSLRGNWAAGAREFLVWSYDTPILAVDMETRRIIHNKRRYSVTTSKQQSYLTAGTAALMAQGFSYELVDGESELWHTLENREKSRFFDRFKAVETEVKS